MKKGWKITLITLGSLLGVVLITVAVALWLVFTPSQLTKIVNNLTGRFLTCEARFEKVDLTMLSTFPDAGLKIEDVVIVNPMEGAASDTLARIGSLTVGIDVKAFLKERKVIVHQVVVDDACAHLYIASDGRTNFAIFPPSDTAKVDTGEFKMPDLVDIEKIKIRRLSATLDDKRDSMQLATALIDIDLKGRLSGEQIDAVLEVSTDGTTSVKTGIVPSAAGEARINLALSDVDLKLTCEGTQELLAGNLKMKVEKGTANIAGNEMVNKQLQSSKHDLLTLKTSFTADLAQKIITLGESHLSLDEYALTLQGEAQLATDSRPLGVDMQLHTDGAWQIKPLLAIVPAQYTQSLKGMDVDGKVALDVAATGTLTDSTMPRVDVGLQLDKGSFYYPSALPYKIERMKGDIAAQLNLAKGGVSYAKINSLSAQTRDTRLNVSGRADDLTGDMSVDAAIKGALPLADLKPLLPDTLPLSAQGDADIDLNVKLKMSHLKAKALDKMKATGRLKLEKLDVVYDSIHATAPTLDIALQLPAKRYQGKLADAHVSGRELVVEMTGKNVKTTLETPDIHLGINNMMKEQLAAAVDLSVGESEAHIDSLLVSLGALELGGSVRLDSTQSNILRKFNPRANINMHSAVLYMPSLPDAMRLSQFEVTYNAKELDIKKADVKVGMSDFSLYGTISDAEAWLSKEKMLTGDLNFVSNYTDADQFMNALSGMGRDADSVEAMRKEDKVDADANPFLVPMDVDVTLHTHIKRCIAFGNDLSDVAGTLTINDGKAVLDQMGFVCKAATMQLTALYESPRPNNLFVALDFHLLDIQINELLDMIPSVDTLVPMLAAFNGNANFHLAAETFLNARYQPKMSSLLGSAAISGKNLVVMDNSSIAQIAKLMQFKSWKEKDDKIRIDSLDVEMSCFRKEVEVFPFLLNIGKNQLCISGRHNLDNRCNYHIELLKSPLLAKVGVDVKGDLKKPKIALGEVKYSDLYRPEKQGVVENRVLETKKRIREALEANVR